MQAKIYTLFKNSTGISTDSRTVQKGNLFFALSGDNFNGNKFALQALKKGAITSIIDDESFSAKNTVLVKNTLKTLQQLAKHHRNELKVSIIALTGSNGKTTTKELINAVLLKKYNTTATIGNLNNHIGVPLTLLNMTKKTEIGIIEMGANHHKEIELLSNIANPNFGYITNFGKAHLEGFGSLEGVIKAKSELYNYLKTHQKVAFVNADNSMQLKQAKNIKQITFSEIKNADVKIEFISASPNVIVVYNQLEIKSNLIGNYNFSNIAASIAIGNYFNVPDNAIKNAIEGYVPTNNRSQIIKKNGNDIILDAYNANPTSMLAALENFNALKTDNKVVFLGDMFELGSNSNTEHQSIVDYLQKSDINAVYLLGAHFSNVNIYENMQVFTDFSDFKVAFKTVEKNSSILIKGSRGMALERILELI